MLLCKVCERAAESVIDELVLCAASGNYPERLTVLIDGLLNLTNFEWEQDQFDRLQEIPIDHNLGGRLIYKLLSSTFVGKHYKNSEQMNNLAKLFVHMCEVNESFKLAFIKDMDDPECGIEAFRFELGDAVGDLCVEVMRAIQPT